MCVCIYKEKGSVSLAENRAASRQRHCQWAPAGGMAEHGRVKDASAAGTEEV